MHCLRRASRHLKAGASCSIAARDGGAAPRPASEARCGACGAGGHASRLAHERCGTYLEPATTEHEPWSANKPGRRAKALHQPAKDEEVRVSGRQPDRHRLAFGLRQLGLHGRRRRSLVRCQLRRPRRRGPCAPWMPEARERVAVVHCCCLMLHARRTCAGTASWMTSSSASSSTTAHSPCSSG